MVSRLMVGCVAIVGMMVTVYAAGGPKRTGDACSIDDDCSRGHCHTKDSGQKVCLDCSSSEISDYRGQIQLYCKDEPTGCTSTPPTPEIAEDFFNIRIANGDRCVAARKAENDRCWSGGDSGHRTAADEAEKARKNCYDGLNRRRGEGKVYTCSESTYLSLRSAVDSACASYGKGCQSWSKDDKPASCSEIEDAMRRAAKCVEGVEKIDSDCLPRLSSIRETQFSEGKQAFDYCKEVLAYKKDKSLCK